MPQIYEDRDPGVLVNWTAGQLMPAPRADRPTRQEMMYPCRCVNCGSVRWLTRSAAEKAEVENRVCRRCQTVAAGKKGYAATARAYGPDFAFNAVRAKQISGPSTYEMRMNDWICELTFTYEFQSPFCATDPQGGVHRFILDFEIRAPRGKVVVEVNGYWHQRIGAERDYWLKTLYPGHVEFVTTEEMDADPEGVKRRLCAQLSPAQ